MVPSAIVPLTVSTAVAAFYEKRPTSLLWFKPGRTEATTDLLAFLKRGQLDGLAGASVLTAEVEAAIARATAGGAPEKAASDRALSAAWVTYVQALRKPAANVEYGDPASRPKVPDAQWLLLQAEHAPSLQQHLRSIAAVNPIYAQLRDAAWAQLQLEPTLSLDPRLVANLERSRILPSSGRFIIVDAATARLWMYEDGQIVDSMKVIVGRRDAPTPMIASTIYYTTFNPYWNIPTDVVKRVHAPKLVKQGAKYLKAQGFEVTSDWTDDATVVPGDEVDWKAVLDGSKEVRIRQLPGTRNMMGNYKFSFPNGQGIYLHDTPQKGLFEGDKRMHSLGCVRVEDAKRLAQWLLGKEPVAPSADPEQHVQLAKSVPVFVTYLTAHVDQGQLAFSDDVYGLDTPAQSPSQLAAAQ